MYTSKFVLYNRSGWRLTSYGLGAAYLLEDTEKGTSVFFQGDDALQFRSEIFDEDGFFRDWLEDAFANYLEAMQ